MSGCAAPVENMNLIGHSQQVRTSMFACLQCDGWRRFSANLTPARFRALHPTCRDVMTNLKLRE